MTKQTAIEELIKEMESLLNKPYINPKNALNDCTHLAYNKLTLERRNIIDSYSHGWHDGQDVIINKIKHIDIGGDEAGKNHFNYYFTETYGKEESPS